jgi:hypothetical protein
MADESKHEIGSSGLSNELWLCWWSLSAVGIILPCKDYLLKLSFLTIPWSAHWPKLPPVTP